MAQEKMKVLELLEAGKISAQEATTLLESLGRPTLMSKDTRDNVEEKLHHFAGEVNKFAKEVGGKAKTLYKDVEPKIKKASQHALEKAAAALDNLAHTINESLEKNAEKCECDDNCDCASREN
ncbi:MAG: hypothetical protein FWC78_06875 [Defluviitaleaceae bacterium]|nr:hypothetical protein [Defluviitaleaceae bacterium]